MSVSMVSLTRSAADTRSPPDSMPIPVTSAPASPRTIARGVAIPSLQIVATNSPTTYAAAPLPTGLSVDTTTGVITGTPVTEGLTTTVISATNADGYSNSVSLVWNVQAAAVGGGSWSDLELDIDFHTRKVSIPGVSIPADGAVFRVGKGDYFYLLIGLLKYGVLQDLSASSEIVGVRCALKEFEPESIITLANGIPTTKVGSADTARFRIPIWFSPENWQGVLSNYEDDERTSVYANAEIELTSNELRLTTIPFKVEVIRDQVPD